MIEQLSTLGIGRSGILHTAESMFHDHAPANRAGLASCHVYRRAGKEGFGATMPPETIPHFDFRFESIAALVEAHREEA